MSTISPVEASSSRLPSRPSHSQRRQLAPLSTHNTNIPIPPSLVGKLNQMRTQVPLAAEGWIDAAEWSTPSKINAASEESHRTRHRRNSLLTTSPVDIIPPPYPSAQTHYQPSRSAPIHDPSRSSPCMSAPIQSYDLHLLHFGEVSSDAQFDHGRGSRMAEVTRWRS